MKTDQTKSANVLDSESFGNSRQQYYLDIKESKNKRFFLQITNLRNNGAEQYKRTHVILFEEDLAFFIEAVTMLLSRHSSGNHGISC